MVEIAASSFAVDHGRKSRLQGLARHILEEQDRREDYFPDVRVDEVPWRMLLLLYVSGTGRLSSESLWRSVPASPAAGSRWIDYLASEKLVTRHVEPSDKSRSMVELTPNGIGLLDLYLGDRLQRGGVRTEPCPERGRSGRSGTPVGIMVLVTAALSAGITYLLTSFGAFARILDWD